MGQWLKGENKDPVFASMDPAKATNDDGGMVFQKKMTYQELEDENAALKARVKELEEKLGISSEEEPQEEPAADGGADEAADAAADEDLQSCKLAEWCPRSFELL